MAVPKAELAPILWLHSHFMLPTGGTKYVFEVARRLAEIRPVEVMVERASPLWRDMYRDAGVRLHEIGGPTSMNLNYWGAFPAFLRRDRKQVQQIIKDFGVVLSSFFPMPYIASKLAADTGVRHVSLCFEPFPFFHDREIVGLYRPPKRALLALLKAAYGRIDIEGIRQAEQILTLNSSTAAEILAVYGREDVLPIYAGVDTEIFHPYSSLEVADLVRRVGPGPIVVHSTDFSPIKRTDLAVEAFAEAVRKVPNARMALTSTREDSGALASIMSRARELGVAEKIVFLGFLPYRDLPRLYSLADVLLQTGTSLGSGATTMSLPVKEAMACGTSVIRSGATDEDVEDGVSGYLVDPSDVVDVGARLASLLGEPERARQMGQQGIERIRATYNWDQVVAAVLGSIEGP